MDFFEHQDEARRKTHRLVVLFGLAVALIVVAIYLPLSFVVGPMAHGVDKLDRLGDLARVLPFDPEPWLRWFQPRLLLGVTVGVVAVVGLGSLVRTLALRAGGGAVAESLGGRPVPPATTDARERRLLNVVEEMAIASGSPVPAVYVLDGEDGINAFAAGWSLDDAAVAVTEGALDQLSRDELQGVIAHEFSHILNGDMRLNIRLLGLLHGILLISLIGRGILRSLGQAGRVRSRGRGSAGPIVAALLFGLLLTAVGFIGWFFGQLIKAGVSRQREFLADASAVQFTRNPGGLGGALQRIADSVSGSLLAHPRAEEASHLLFGSPLKRGFFQRALASHPPIDERIDRIGVAVPPREPAPSAAPGPPGTPPATALGFAGGASSSVQLDPGQLVQQVGTLDALHIEASAGVLRGLPHRLREAVESPFGAVAMLYALVLDSSSAAREAQLDTVFGEARPKVFDEMLALFERLQAAPASIRLPLAELAVLPLRTLPPETLEPVLDTLRRLIEADGEVELFEFALHRIVCRRLEAARSQVAQRPGRPIALPELLPDAGLFLSCLAHVGHGTAEEANRAFHHGAHCLSLGGGLGLLPPEDCQLDRLAAALDRLSHAVPGLRRELMDAASHCVLADREVTVREAELLRVLAADLGCPLPLFLSP